MKSAMLRHCHWLSAVAALMAGICGRAAEPVPISLYDKDPNHLWNRLYSALMTRAPELDAAVNDLLDPPFWFNTQHLLDGDSNRQAVALLGEFVKGQPLPGSMTAWQRAVMQRDLLGILHWLADREFSQRGAWTAPQRELSAALARAIRGVALTEEEIRKLPDNYAAAVAAPDAVTAFDAAHPAPFLPKDLLADDGPWIALERMGDSEMAATVHFMLFQSRSVFEVRMRHPEGRAEGKAYLKQLADMPNPFLKEKPARPVRDPVGPPAGPWLNPETPQFPPGTMWALVRRAVLADTKGTPVVSPLVESVQIRVYRNLDAQTFFEWETRHSLLLGNGGFHLTKPEDQLYAHFFQVDEPPLKGRSIQTELFCIGCHQAPGIHSVNSRNLIFQERRDRPPEFRAVSRARIDEVTAARAGALPGWMLLRSLWDNSTGPGAGKVSPLTKPD